MLRVYVTKRVCLMYPNPQVRHEVKVHSDQLFSYCAPERVYDWPVR